MCRARTTGLGAAGAKPPPGRCRSSSLGRPSGAIIAKREMVWAFTEEVGPHRPSRSVTSSAPARTSAPGRPHPGPPRAPPSSTATAGTRDRVTGGGQEEVVTSRAERSNSSVVAVLRSPDVLALPGVHQHVGVAAATESLGERRHPPKVTLYHGKVSGSRLPHARGPRVETVGGEEARGRRSRGSIESPPDDDSAFTRAASRPRRGRTARRSDGRARLRVRGRRTRAPARRRAAARGIRRTAATADGTRDEDAETAALHGTRIDRSRRGVRAHTA